MVFISLLLRLDLVLRHLDIEWPALYIYRVRETLGNKSGIRYRKVYIEWDSIM